MFFSSDCWNVIGEKWTMQFQSALEDKSDESFILKLTNKNNVIGRTRRFQGIVEEIDPFSGEIFSTKEIRSSPDSDFIKFELGKQISCFIRLNITLLSLKIEKKTSLETVKILSFMFNKSGKVLCSKSFARFSTATSANFPTDKRREKSVRIIASPQN
ncbi:Oidioi.mRNA.OKI2018_I69.chr1.g1168.t1.cds [Oikopleura dioica]|uniref:Oidioi.mRNA.OKI2018_I69.chr1.g1168.t1.cds n=1 Tax=Oikopleura dioica TaxID=34765 RepID=A0ABN7SM27_OIKDI|nr:Oidioi.mRNA.OKI2018_I69.chr1.g1168.t1.cds [Oikopleura dioica]